MHSIVILGGGPAGLSAAVYAARAGIQTTVLFKDGGALGKTEKIENYFGFSEPMTGTALLQQGREQAARLGAALVQTEVTGIEYAEKGFLVRSTGGAFPADAVILATGAPRVAPPLPGVKELEGCGVSYCAVCDAFFYRGKQVCVLGQGEYALEEAKTLLPVAASVTLLTSGKPAPTSLPDGLKVDTRVVKAIEGQGKVERVAFDEDDPLPVDGVFLAFGTAGSADLARKLGAATEGNRIKVDTSMATTVPLLYAAGDCTGGLLQVSKAVADGAHAALSAIKALRG